MYDLVVIGGGPGGYVAAIRAARLGGKVVLIEKDKLGGVCVNEGCIPTKALSRSIELLLDIEKAGEHGILVKEPALDFARLMARKQQIVQQLVQGVESLMKAHKIEVLHNVGTIASPGKVRIQGQPSRELDCQSIIIATGSQPSRPPVPGVDQEGVITNREILLLDEIPEALAVVGGGVVGVEFATIFNALGTKVTIIEMLPNLLPPVDEELSRRCAQMLTRDGIDINLNSPLRSIERKGRSLLVEYQTPEGLKSISVALVLMATGRRPHTEALNLEATGIEMNKGAILVDEYLQTSVPGIYAVGDVIGGSMLAHMAMRQGEIAAENALGRKAAIDYRAIPSCIFTLPEMAGVGLTEKETKEKGLPYKKSIFRLGASGRAVTIGETRGMVKLVCHAETGEVLGLHLMGPHVTELIVEGTLAIQMGAKASDLVATIHAHPTVSEAVREAALGQFEGPIHAM